MINNIILNGIALVSNAIASLREEHGQDLIEYAVLAGAIGVVAAVALFAIGSGPFDNMAAKIGNCVSFTNPGC